jgi:hypothetical protein
MVKYPLHPLPHPQPLIQDEEIQGADEEVGTGKLLSGESGWNFLHVLLFLSRRIFSAGLYCNYILYF